ncbi:MAG TPA: hypothetical protein VE869_12660, partial [Gemmatimonas sp.]|nr:hypothetical protein [Gemmatimonas sp.]
MRLILAPALLVLASVAPPLRAQPVELAQRRSELLRTVQRADSQMRNGSFAAAIAPLFAPNGIYSANLKTDLRGASGARTFWSRDTLNARSTGRWIVIRHDVSADGRDGYTYGLFDVVRPSGDTLPGGFHAYWRRTDDGQWQILAMS